MVFGATAVQVSTMELTSDTQPNIFPREFGAYSVARWRVNRHIAIELEALLAGVGS